VWRSVTRKRRKPLSQLINDQIKDEYSRLYNSPSSRMLFPEKAVQVCAGAASVCAALARRSLQVHIEKSEAKANNIDPMDAVLRKLVQVVHALEALCLGLKSYTLFCI
jgi:hypothetical protein